MLGLSEGEGIAGGVGEDSREGTNPLICQEVAAG